MAPKKGAAPVVPAEDVTLDAVVVITVAPSPLQLGFYASPDQAVGQPVTDATLAPPLLLELKHGADDPVHGSPAALQAALDDFGQPTGGTVYAFAAEHNFKHRKGADLANRLVNTQVAVRVCNATNGALLATAAIDLLAFGLGATGIPGPVELLPAKAEGEAFRVQPGATLAASAQLLHVAQAPTPGAEPQYEPYCAVPESEASGCNVLTFRPESMQPLPARFPCAVAAAGGSLTCAVALQVPGVGALVAAGGSLQGQKLMWSSAARAYMPPAAGAALKAALETGTPLLLEVARQTGPEAANMQDPAWGAHHALFCMDCTDELQVPGSCTAAGVAAAVGAYEDAAPADLEAVLHCSPPTTLGSKAKAIDEAPASTEAGGPLPCAWQQAGSKLQVSLRLARPLYAPWQAPPRPTRGLADLLPPRVERPAPMPTAADSFRSKVKQLAQALARDYAAVAAAAGPAADDPLQLLVRELNSSGRYLEIKAQLRDEVAKLVKERLAGRGAASAASLQTELYAQLVEDMRLSLCEALQPATCAARAQQAACVASAAASRLAQRAAECEAAGEYARAASLHQEHVAASSSAEAWYAYGEFCIRHQARDKAQECVQQALLLDPRHVPSLAALTGLALDQAVAGEHGAADRAVVAAHALKDAQPGQAWPWALLAVAYKLQGPAKEPEARSSQQEVLRLAKAAGASLAAAEAAVEAVAAPPPPATQAALAAGEGEQPGGGQQEAAPAALVDLPALRAAVAAATKDPNLNGYLEAAEQLAALQLAAPAERAMTAAAGLKDGAARLDRRMRLCLARAAHAAGNSAQALEMLAGLEQSMQEAGNAELAPLLLAADIHFQARIWPATKQYYRRAIQLAPSTCGTAAYLRAAYATLMLGDLPAAMNAYHLACEAVPCAEAWLGVGMSALRLGELHEADLALSEANRLDARHPAVWGYLGLLALKQGRPAEAEQAIQQAQACGLDQPALLAELGSEWALLGRWRPAEALLARSLQLADAPAVRCQLAHVLLAQHKHAACQEQLEAAGRLAGEGEAELLARAWAALKVAWPRIDDS